MLERLIDPLLATIAPHTCLACRREGALLCADCATLLPDIEPACYRCGRVGSWEVCDQCREHVALRHVQAMTPYESFAEALLQSYKFERGYSAHRQIAQVLAGASLPSDALLVPVPTITNHVRWRGYDHAQLIARRLSKLTRLPTARLLERTNQLSQTGKKRAERLGQLGGAIVLRSAPPKNAKIVLIDDVMTTGATLEQCALVLHAAGASDISGVVFARAE